MSEGIALVGRDAALATLRDALAQAEARHGQLVLLSGEPGVGKSALAEQLGREAEARGASVVHGRAWELAEAPPYFPVWPCLRALGLEPPSGPAPEAAFHLWERVLTALGRAAEQRTVVWILDDLHAADLLTLDLLTFLARPLRALGVLLLVTQRDRDARLAGPTAARLARMARDGRELRLDVLPAAEVATLASAVAGHALTPAFLAELCELTGGNPLFVIECARAWRVGTPMRLPASVRELTGERVAQLPASAREVLACGAVIGRDFSAAVVARMQDGLPAQIIERLTPALRAGLVLETRPGQYRFSHILVRDAIEEALEPAPRAELHARAGQALAQAGDSADVVIERARHALAALRPEGDPVGLALRAARELEAQGAHDRAFALYLRIEDAVEAGLPAPPPSADDALHRAVVARAAGRHAEARRRCEAVLGDARGRRDGELMARAALTLGGELRPGTVDAGLVAALREAQTLLHAGTSGSATDALVCRVQARLAAALQPADDPRGPMTMALEALGRARTLGDDLLLREVLQFAGSALVDYAPWAQRIALGQELRDRALAAGDTPRALQAHARLALDQAALGNLPAFEAEVERLLELSLEAGHPRLRWRALLLESMRALSRGDCERSDRCVVEVQQHASVSDDPALATALAAHLINRAVLLHRDGDMRPALDDVMRVMDAVPHADILISCLQMSAFARVENIDATLRAFARVRGRAPLACNDLRYLTMEACALVATREEQLAFRAELLPDAALHMVSGHVPMTYEGPVGRLIALLDSRLGDHDSAIARLTTARADASAAHLSAWVAQLDYDLGRAFAAASRPPEAHAAFTRALTAAESLPLPGLIQRSHQRLTSGPVPKTVPVPVPAPDPSSPHPTTTSITLTLTREADLWLITDHSARAAAPRHTRVRHTRGMELLARLIERPDEEIHVLTLASDGPATLVEADAGDLLDPRARREYKARLDELTAELDAAERDADLGRHARLIRERDALESELARAVGLRGRARPAASATERARVNVQRRLKDALTRISDADADLGARLTRAIHTGTYCSYQP